VNNSDDILKADIFGKNLIIRLGGGSIYFNGEKLDLSPAVVMKNHIYVQEKLLELVSGVELSEYTDMKTTFINYYPDFRNIAGKHIKLLRLDNGKAGVSELLGRSLHDINSNNSQLSDSFMSNRNNSVYFLKTDNKMYAVGKDTGKLIYAGEINPSAEMSPDGRYIYWINVDTDKLVVFDTSTWEKRELDNYPEKIKTHDEELYNIQSEWILDDIRIGKYYKRVAFKSKDTDETYIFLERQGRDIVSGIGSYSPDKCRILFYKNGQGYFTVNTDGTHIMFIGEGTSAQWINNDRILLTTVDGDYLTDRNGRNGVKAGNEWKMVGKTYQGDVFFTRDNILYLESGSIERKVADLPWNCKWAYTNSPEGPYILISDKEDGVYFLSGGKFKALGDSRLIPGTTGGNINNDLYGDSLFISPDNSKAVALQEEGGFTSINITNRKMGETKKILIDYSKDYGTPDNYLKHIWLSDGQLLLFTAGKGWLLDMDGKMCIYSWKEDPGTTLAGVLP
jgi:hypothetical protein